MQAWPKVAWSDAAQILDLMELDEPPLGDATSVAAEPQAYFEALVAAGLLREAADFVVHALPRYEGIVWAVQTLLGQGAIDRGMPLVVAILRWVDNPDDERRRAAFMLVDGASKRDPARMLGMAVFMSGGSISEPDLPPVLAPHGVSAKLASGAVQMAAYATARPDLILGHAIDIGRQAASQGA